MIPREAKRVERRAGDRGIAWEPALAEIWRTNNDSQVGIFDYDSNERIEQ